MASDDRSAGQQMSDLIGLFSGRTKLQGGRIVPKNPPTPPAPPASPAPHVDVHVDVDVDW